MNITGDQYLVKEINKSLIIDFIRNNSPTTKPQIVKATSLNKGTVSRLVNELLESSLFYEVGSGVSTGGRIPTMYALNNSAGFAIGIDLKINSLTAALTDLSGTIILRHKINLANMDVKYVNSQLKNSINYLLDNAPSSTFGIIGIGIGFPGIIDENGAVLIAPSLNWNQVDLRNSLQKNYDIPIIIDNEARAGIIGEKQFGEVKESKNVIFVSIGNSIGSGVIINNELYKGNAGISGEAGHITIETHGKKCVCGNKGCWQEYASVKVLLSNVYNSDMGKAYEKEFNNTPIDLPLISTLAKEGNLEVLEHIKQTGEYIGIGLANLINLFNPEKVIIGGSITEISEWLYPSIIDTIEERALPFHMNNLEVVFSNLGIDSTLRGATSLVLADFFAGTRIS